MLQDWKQDARRFEDIDREAVLAIGEADDAEKYRERFGKWPENLSGRAWRELQARGDAANRDTPLN